MLGRREDSRQELVVVIVLAVVVGVVRVVVGAVGVAQAVVLKVLEMCLLPQLLRQVGGGQPMSAANSWNPCCNGVPTLTNVEILGCGRTKAFPAAAVHSM